MVQISEIDFSLVKPAPHSVEFYGNDAVLIASVAKFVHSGLSAGEGVFIIASPIHNMAILEKLRALNIDTEIAIQNGQLSYFDAQFLLNKFMHGQTPDPLLFSNIIGGMMEKIQQTYPVVRAYGEMVDLLWSEGNVMGTIALERLWNDLLNEKSFSLLCGYHMHGFGAPSDEASFREICHNHSHVRPDESYTGSETNSAYLRLIAELQQKSLALQSEIAERGRVERALHKAQAELKLAKEAAVLANHSKSQFLANMSHEIRTPLNAMLGFAELLLEPNHSEHDQSKHLEIILRNGKHLNRLVDEILDLAKIESEQMTIEKEPFALRDLVAAVTALLSLKAKKKRLSLRTEFQGALPHTIVSDPTRLRQILMNLLGNALKFTDAGEVCVLVTPSVRIPEPGKLAIDVSVQDSGIGLSQAEARKYGGTGLGLYLSKRLALALGGDLVLADSKPGLGSRFVLTLVVDEA